MSNIIKIKHGSNIPTTADLENYELGYCKGKGLFINEDGKIVQLTSVIESDATDTPDQEEQT